MIATIAQPGGTLPMAEYIFKFTARFVDAGTGKPLSGAGFSVRFLDRDALKDDVLGEGALAPDGRAEVLTTSSAFRSRLMGLLAMAEKKPDVYCEVREGGKTIYRTRVAWNLDVERLNAVTKSPDRTIDLGVFKFRRGEGLEETGTGTPVRATF